MEVVTPDLEHPITEHGKYIISQQVSALIQVFNAAINAYVSMLAVAGHRASVTITKPAV
jgi:hypothetical protein